MSKKIYIYKTNRKVLQSLWKTRGSLLATGLENPLFASRLEKQRYNNAVANLLDIHRPILSREDLYREPTRRHQTVSKVPKYDWTGWHREMNEQVKPSLWQRIKRLRRKK